MYVGSIEVLGRLAAGCICGKRMLERINQGTCLWCGRGQVTRVVEFAYRNNMERNHGPAEVVALSSAPRRSADWTDETCIEAYWAWTTAKGRRPTSGDWLRSGDDGTSRPSYGTIHKRFGGWKGFLRAISEVPREQVAA